MKEAKTLLHKGVVHHYREFNSISEFMEFIESTPTNEVYKSKPHASHSLKQPRWYGTANYEEALEKLRHGDHTLAKRLNGTLKLDKHPENTLVQKPTFGVVGYQASVPRYLQGLPTNMVTKKQVVQKQKVVSITKNIGYLAQYSVSDIIEEAVKAVQLINTIEAHGIRCNLYISSIAQAGNTAIGFRIKIKSANERTHISKLAFPLVNPSMLRRFSFRYREVAPETTNAFGYSYGYSIQPDYIFATKKGEHFIPTMMNPGEFEKLLDKVLK